MSVKADSNGLDQAVRMRRLIWYRDLHIRKKIQLFLARVNVFIRQPIKLLNGGRKHWNLRPTDFNRIQRGKTCFKRQM